MQTTHYETKPVTNNAYHLTQKLVEGLIIYRHELGELGYNLELLLRCERVLTMDRAYLQRVH